MASASPPKPWERAGAGASAGVMPQSAAPSIPLPTTALSSASTPAIPQRPSTLTSTVNQNASAYSPYGGANRLGTSPYGGGGVGGGMSSYSSPYSRMGGGMGGYGSSMYGGGMGGGMGGYGMGGMGGYGMGGMGGMGGYGMGGMGGGMGGNDPNDPNSLTHSFSQSTQATFHIIESIVGAFGGFAQMLESTYMATHSSFFAMVSVAEQFGNLRNTLGSILGIFTVMRWIRTLLAKLTGRPLPVDATALTPAAFASFEGRQLPEGHPMAGPPKLSKKPFLVFLLAAVGLPYLMGKLIKSLAANQEAAERARLSAQGVQFGPDGQPLPQAALDPSQLDYCRVLYDFTPEAGAAVQGVDLAVAKGDLVAVLSRSDPLGQPSEWWRCRARDGRVGYLPGVYLAEARKAAAAPAQIAAKGAASRTSTMSSIGNGQGAMAPLVQGKAGDISAESFQKSQFYS